ncbi:MAG: pyrroline-5-carboxylate reductase [Clostridiales Family XIII bacterium]|nr:pyrroline-5-carboxylate reductase [Clostridiales Family XIII bacterium]
MKELKLGILGAGNMGGAIARGYAQASGGSEELYLFDQDDLKVQQIAVLPGVTAVSGIEELVLKSKVLLFAVKPNAFDEVLPQIAAYAEKAEGSSRIYVSIAAGISIAYLESKLGAASRIVRVMPNTPAMVGAGMSALARNANVTDSDFQNVFRIFESIGRAVEVTEEQIHAVIGLSGSSPAYAYMYIRALIEDGIRQGLSPETARLLAAQSTLGAAKMVLDTDISAAQLCINVCSPGGTTIEAVHVLEEKNFIETVGAASDAAIAKSKLMTK